MPKAAPLARGAWLLPAAFLALFAPGCGGGAQSRPSVVSIFPADGSTFPGAVSYARVVYDEPVKVLSDEGVRVAAEVAGDDEKVHVVVTSDPSDDHALLVFPTNNGHFLAGTRFHLVVGQGAAVNMDDHYSLDEEDVWFMTGVAPNLFVTTTGGAVHEIDRSTGALVQTTTPPAGTTAHDPVGGDGRLWVWLDPVVPGASQVGTFVPGDAAITTTVPLSGSLGAEAGTRLLLSRDGRTLYALGFDPVRGQVLVHRIDTDGLTEIATPLILSSPVPSAADVFQPTVDEDRHRLYVPTSNPAGGSFVSAADVDTFLETDLIAGPGIDPLVVPIARGPATWEPIRDYLYVLDTTSSFPAFAKIDADDLDVHPASEPTLVGSPVAILATSDGVNLVQGLAGYSGLDGLVETRTQNLGDGFPIALSDDVGGGPQGSNRIDALLADPFAEHFFAFASNGVSSVVALYDFDGGDVVQIDLDTGTAGIQSLPVGAPGVVTGATTLTGVRPPP